MVVVKGGGGGMEVNGLGDGVGSGGKDFRE